MRPEITIKTRCTAVVECSKGNGKNVAATWVVGFDEVTLCQAPGSEITMSQSQFFDLVELAPFVGVSPASVKDKRIDALSMPVHHVNFTGRVRKYVEKMGIKTLGDLVKLSRTDIYKSPNMGRLSVREIIDVLGVYDLKLAEH